MIPAFSATLQPDGSAIFQLRQIYWLLLVIIRPGADITVNERLVDYLIHVSRLGAAFDRLVQAQLNMTVCSPSVARARIKALGLRVALEDPIPFTAMAADLYAVIPDPVCTLWLVRPNLRKPLRRPCL